MKQIILKSIVAILAASLFVSCSSYSPLYERADYYIDELSTHYDSYRLSAIGDEGLTSDGKFALCPVGRLIIITPMDPMTDEQIEGVLKKLSDHYARDYRVNDVFINRRGDITIDCRR